MLKHLSLALPWLALSLTSTQVSATPLYRRDDNSTTYDYIIVGSGPGGMTVADKISETGASVLLIERGPPSTAQWGGTERPDWLNNTDLSFYDVPALDDQIWTKGGNFTDGIFCDDIISAIAGCVLGGGSAVNSGLWWKPAAADWDSQFPEGWHSQDIANATERAFSRIPGTETPSTDHKLYIQQGAHVIEGALAAANWTEVSANSVPDQKNRVYSNTTFMFIDGERGGPLATYLVSASARPNFSLWMNTFVDRVVRNGSTITGVDVSGEHSGTVQLSGKGGVILSAGAFGTPKILFRSGIGPKDQLQIVANSSDAAKLISQDQWIDLPVGYNLMDNINTDIVVSHPDVVYYDFAALWDGPLPTSDIQAYLGNRTGMLAQSASNLNPMLWETLTGEDGIFRTLQWTARVDTSLSIENTNLTNMVLSNYVTLGQVARGRTEITSDLSMNVTVSPGIDKSAADQAAIAKGIEDMRAVLGNVKDLQILSPPSNISAADYVSTTQHGYVNHWIGSCKLGSDDGRKANGTSVVDADTKVYGTDNLFVVDGSIFPGQTTSNPCAAIVVLAEHAAERILALTS